MSKLWSMIPWKYTLYLLYNRNDVKTQVNDTKYYVIKFVSGLRQVGGFLQVLRFPPPIKLTATIYKTKAEICHGQVYVPKKERRKKRKRRKRIIIIIIL
jgi:hypothetical protein